LNQEGGGKGNFRTCGALPGEGKRGKKKKIDRARLNVIRGGKEAPVFMDHGREDGQKE